MKDKLNVFGEPDDIQQALYSSWADAADAACILQRVMARYRHNQELTSELQEVLDKLKECGESVRSFAPNYHRETLEGWAQSAAESNHP
jgi:hypothetical protein